jgi:uncharacterized protein involved in exopolysaccharide biosynthesis
MAGSIGSPLSAVDDELRRTELEMKRCYGAAAPEEAPRAPRIKNTPGCRRLRELEKSKDDVLSRVTAQHPEAIAIENEIKKQSAICEREADPSDVGMKPGMSPEQCAAAVRDRVSRLNSKKIELQSGASKKPKLERRWAELNLEGAALDTEWTALKETYRKTVKERLIAANEFKDSFVLVDLPRIPELPSYPDRNQFMLMGIAITFILGVSLAVGREALRQTFVDAREVEEQTGLSVLASLPSISADE